MANLMPALALLWMRSWIVTEGTADQQSTLLPASVLAVIVPLGLSLIAGAVAFKRPGRAARILGLAAGGHLVLALLWVTPLWLGGSFGGMTGAPLR